MVIGPFPPKPHVMTTTLLAGILTAFAAVTLAAGLRRAPLRALCPVCGAATNAVQLPPPLRSAAPDLRVRWCPDCSWEGLGREGAEAVPGRPMAHTSGFRWGGIRFQQDFGFRFAPVEEATEPPPREPPAHPSGFRFAEQARAAGVGEPAGVRREGAAGAPGQADEAAEGFRWAGPRPPSRFLWGEERAKTEDPPGFRWKG